MLNKKTKQISVENTIIHITQHKRGGNNTLIKKGNMRDYTTIEQLIVLANLESINAKLIKMKLLQDERLIKLNQTAIHQMKTLTQIPNLPKLNMKND